MVHRVRELKSYSVGAQEGPIGRVRDLYFDDRRWAIRYLVVDTDHWLAGRRVLISARSPQGMEAADRTLPASLTREQVANSPDEDQLPLVEVGMATTVPLETASGRDPREEHEDPHLRSARAVTHYRVHVRDATIGHVSDFLFDDASWTIGHIVVATGGWWPGRSVLVPVRWVRELSWARDRVDVGLPSEAIRRAPEYDASLPPGAEYLARLAAYYGVPAGSAGPASPAGRPTP